jgi:2,3-bisphosphoglycerate-independent phosphoglycerate mutase
VTDRRAGRISTEKNRELVEKLRSIEIEGADVFVETIKEHRFLLVFRGEGLHAKVADTDPQSTGLEPLDAMASAADSERTAELANAFSAKARELLRDESPANMVLLRGFAELPGWPSFEEVYGTRSASIAAYPMYRGLAKLLGMTALDASEDPSDKFARLRRERDKYDFFFVHVKKPDATGEDGDFDAKLAAIEKADKAITELLDAEPDVVVVTGDHSTPWKLKSHGWQPVPVLLYSEYCRPDEVDRFGERACLRGGLGPRIPATDLMPLAMANGLRLEKFGA